MHQALFSFIENYMPLSINEKDAIIALNIFKSVKKNEILLHEGEYTKNSFFVLKGCLRCFYVVDGNEKTTAFYTELEGLTPPSVASQTASQFYIAAVEDSIISTSTSDMEEQVMAQFPKFEKLCRLLSEDLLIKQQIDFNEFKLSSPEQRYQNLLNKRPDLIQRVPQHQLASYLGITPQSLSRLRGRITTKSN
ncbi:MAG: Crp/Fnr family transcriptional regulator [Bacteroidia bacterium]